MKLREYRLCRTGNRYKNDWGYIDIEYRGKSKLLYIAKIMRLMFIEYAECNARGCEASGNTDFVMGWGEFQNQGLTYHSLYKACGGKNPIVSEFPYTLTYHIKRKKPQQLRKRIDYYIYIQKQKYVLLVEYKHSFVTVKFENHDGTVNIDKLDTKPWNDALNKFNAPAEKELLNDYLDQLGSLKSKTYQIVIWIVPIYRRRTDRKEKNNTITREELNKQLNDYISEKWNENPPDLVGCWSLPEEQQINASKWKEKLDNKSVDIREYYHGAYLFCSIKSLNKI